MGENEDNYSKETWRGEGGPEEISRGGLRWGEANIAKDLNLFLGAKGRIHIVGEWLYWKEPREIKGGAGRYTAVRKRGLGPWLKKVQRKNPFSTKKKRDARRRQT